MTDKVLRYQGESIDVTYDLRKCIHAAECIRGLPSVFDPARKPWIDADAGDVDGIAEVIHRCPSGALRYHRRDGGAEEPTPAQNTAEIQKDGPIYLRGKIEVRDQDGIVLSDAPRMALCRCGASSNKPFCDNSHKNAHFVDPGTLGRGGTNVAGMNGDEDRLLITVAENGFLRLAGPVDIIAADGEKRKITKATLCRCGASGNKPFCDSSHREIGFRS